MSEPIPRYFSSGVLGQGLGIDISQMPHCPSLSSSNVQMVEVRSSSQWIGTSEEVAVASTAIPQPQCVCYADRETCAQRGTWPAQDTASGAGTSDGEKIWKGPSAGAKA